jgi:hypothetical protein
MAFKTKSMIFVFAIELGISCLLIVAIVWGIGKSKITTAYAQPIPAPTQTGTQQAFFPAPTLAVTSTIPVKRNPEFKIIFSTPTAILPTATPLPEATATTENVPTLANGPLSTAQQLWLGIVSMRYVAPTTTDGIRLARHLNYIGNDGHPSNICGPLSIAILRDAGIISSDTSLDEFWLLDPKQILARQLLTRTFPPDRFDDLRFDTPLNKFDWKAFPLLPGDFLYLYAGQGGNFEHMLVVNRVDSQKRAYAVTNYGTPNGFVITEVMLYDPNDKSIGIFHTWTKQNYAMLGSTGFGGFEVWRLRSP